MGDAAPRGYYVTVDELDVVALAARDTSRYAISGVMLHEHAGEHYAVATDGRRLMTRTVAAHGDGLPSVILSRSDVVALQKLLKTVLPDRQWAIVNLADESQTDQNDIRQVRVTVPVLNSQQTLCTEPGRFPDYWDVVPAPAPDDVVIAVNPQYLREILAAIPDVADMRLVFLRMSRPELCRDYRCSWTRRPLMVISPTTRARAVLMPVGLEQYLVDQADALQAGKTVDGGETFPPPPPPLPPAEDEDEDEDDDDALEDDDEDVIVEHESVETAEDQSPDAAAVA